MGCALWPWCFITCLLQCQLDGAGAWRGAGDAVLGIMFMGVSWRWKKVSSAWFAGAASFCVRTSARRWFCLLSLVVCELLRDDVAWDVRNKKDFPWSFCESDWDCHAKGSTALSNNRERRRCGGACPLKAFQLGKCVQMRCLRSASLRKCGWCRVSPTVEVGLCGVWHLIWVGKPKAVCTECLILIRWLKLFLFSGTTWMWFFALLLQEKPEKSES